jgi:hypothetical protein
MGPKGVGLGAGVQFAHPADAFGQLDLTLERDLASIIQGGSLDIDQAGEDDLIGIE